MNGEKEPFSNHPIEKSLKYHPEAIHLHDFVFQPEIIYQKV